jgi:hypothetical protein
MNQNYNSNQSVIDTSQLSNSNKWCSYREAYLLMPLLLTLSSPAAVFKPSGVAAAAAATNTSSDYAIGLKNWFGTMIHSITVDWAGTTIIQQTPYINMWNSFKLMTSLSWADVHTMGSTIGFYPDDPLSFTYQAAASPAGQGVCNNSNAGSFAPSTASITGVGFNAYNTGKGNIGFLKRQQFINFDYSGAIEAGGASTYATLLSANATNNIWKSYVQVKANGLVGTPAQQDTGILEIAVCATVYLKHLHSFFASCPLVKGAFLKITLNLNNTTTTFTSQTAGGAGAPTALTLVSVANPVGGVNPLMIASAATLDGLDNGSRNLGGLTGGGPATYTATVQVGARALSSAVTALAGAGGYTEGALAKSVYLYIPLYSFAPTFETAYLSSPVKSIKYTDVYQYQVLGVKSNGQFNNLLTNGIANLKSVLLLPYYSVGEGAGNTGIPVGIPVYQSPFDPAGAGPTSPLCMFTNFNVVVSGQNAIYNTEMRAFEQFNNQLYGCNAVNAGMTDGLTSSLINSLGFEMEYCYWYVNVGRMLPVEESVPKSVQIIGTNQSQKTVDLFAFLEYGCEIAVDLLTGSRV